MNTPPTQGSLNFVSVFCDFSLFDIPVGHIFSQVLNSGQNRVYSGSIVLQSVTQQFAKPFDEVPKGWRTICTFSYDDSGNEKPFDTLDITETWVCTDNFLIVSD